MKLSNNSKTSICNLSVGFRLPLHIGILAFLMMGCSARYTYDDYEDMLATVKKYNEKRVDIVTVDEDGAKKKAYRGYFLGKPTIKANIVQLYLLGRAWGSYSGIELRIRPQHTDIYNIVLAYPYEANWLNGYFEILPAQTLEGGKWHRITRRFSELVNIANRVRLPLTRYPFTELEGGIVRIRRMGERKSDAYCDILPPIVYRESPRYRFF